MQLNRKLALAAATLAVSVACGADAQNAAYDQPFRPQVHFSPRHNWTNDPNGLVFFHGEYHLFYQYNPFGDQWGHMSWGHAVSKDLLHWQELPVALPEHDGVMIFTGSVVVDHGNTSGLCAPQPECLVAIYTGAGDTREGPRQNQNLAYSVDDGRTWKQYQNNPVVDLHMADFRDPSVSWDEREHHWVMAVSLPKEHKVRFYASPDLKSWTKLSDFGPAGDIAGDWECPDLLRIPAADGKGKETWALKIGLNPGAPQGGSGEQYFLGSFDGTSFAVSPMPGAHGWTNYGKDDYCAISFNGLAADVKPVLIGWMSNWQYAAKLPTAPWRGQMSLPRQLSFLQDQAGMALRQQPVIAPLRMTSRSVSFSSGSPTQLVNLVSPAELDLTFSSEKGAQFGLRLYTDDAHWTEIGFDRSKGEFYMDRTRSGLTISPDFPARTTAPLVAGRPMNLTLVVDRSSVEAFVQDGTVVMTDLIYPASINIRVQAFSKPGSSLQVKGEAHELRSIWGQ